MPDLNEIGWQVLDPDGEVVQEGEVTVVEASMIEEITQRLAELAAENEGER